MRRRIAWLLLAWLGLCTPAQAQSLTVPVVRLGGAAQSPALVSTGVPFGPGQLRSEGDVAILVEGQEVPIATAVLARWPQDQSVRSVLVQFRLPIPDEARLVTLRWGMARVTEPIAAVPVRWEIPEAWLALPAEWLCASQVVGEQVPLYRHAFPAYDERLMNAYGSRRDDPRRDDIREDGYYSTPFVFYQLYVRSGDPEVLLAARREALHYREHEVLREGPHRGRHKTYPETRYLYVEALAADYLLTGDERSKAVAGFMAEYLKAQFPPRKAFYPKGARTFWTEREAAFPLLGMVTYYEISGERRYLDAAAQIVENLRKTQQQWPGRGGFIHNLSAHDPTERARKDEYGGSPFMTGLLLEGLIEYHRMTGDPAAASSIGLALDWLMREAAAPGGQGFRYLTARHYDREPAPLDLNLLIAHAFGYGWRLSGYTRTDYLEVGRRIFRLGYEQAYLKDRKHFNQNFRSSGKFLAYIAAGTTP